MSLVQPTLGTFVFGCPGGGKVAGTVVLHLILNCRYRHQAPLCSLHSVYFYQRRAFYSINPLPAPLTQQSTVPPEEPYIQSRPPIHCVNGLWE